MIEFSIEATGIPWLIIQLNRTKETVSKEMNKYVKESAREYVDRVIQAINDQEYRNQWKDLKPSYKAYKKRIGAPEGIWMLTGSLLGALKARRIRKSTGYYVQWSAGLLEGDSRYMYGRKPTSIIDYAKRNEKIRPVFGPVARDFERTFVRGASDILKKVQKQWQSKS
jgi:hypothetical protein